jgi:hypothetical protein
MNERYKPKPPTIRALLREYTDGLCVSDICAKTGIEMKVARACLKKMEDAYIDRWLGGGYQRPSEAIWCVVLVPENCPRPKKNK